MLAYLVACTLLVLHGDVVVKSSPTDDTEPCMKTGMSSHACRLSDKSSFYHTAAQCKHQFPLPRLSPQGCVVWCSVQRQCVTPTAKQSQHVTGDQ